MNSFQLDDRLNADTVFVKSLTLCDLRLMNDQRWPWLILVPRRPGLVELTDMTPDEQASLTYESAHVTTVLKTITKCEKINTGALGNIVRQLHFHIIARNTDDAGWPGPVWGFGTREPYPTDAALIFAATLQNAI